MGLHAPLSCYRSLASQLTTSRASQNSGSARARPAHLHSRVHLLRTLSFRVLLRLVPASRSCSRLKSPRSQRPDILDESPLFSFRFWKSSAARLLGCSQEANLSGLGRSPCLGNSKGDTLPNLATRKFLFIYGLPLLRMKDAFLSSAPCALGVWSAFATDRIARGGHANGFRRPMHPRIARCTRRHRCWQAIRKTRLLTGVTYAGESLFSGTTFSLEKATECIHASESTICWPSLLARRGSHAICMPQMQGVRHNWHD